VTKRSWQPARGLTEREHLQLFKRLQLWRLDHPDARPAPLWEQLHQFFDTQWLLQYPMDREYIRHRRWSFVRQGRQRKKTLKEAYQYAVDACRGTPAEANAEMMKKDFDALEKKFKRRKQRRRRQLRRV